MMCDYQTGAPTAAELGWDNAEHDVDGNIFAPGRENPTPTDRFAAYPDRTSHEYNASMTDDDAYWAALPDTLTPTQLAKILSVGKPAILSRLRAGVIPGYQIRASWIIFKPEIRAWLASTSNRAPVEPPKPVDVLADYGDAMTYQDLMVLFGKTKQTVYIWLHEGEIPAFHIGNRWVIHKAQVRERLSEVSNQNVRSGDVDDTPNASR
jgi:excisionase family DNA binding protein